MNENRRLSLIALVATLCTFAQTGIAKVPPPEQVIKIAIQAPATNYAIQIKEVRKVDGILWVLSEVRMVGEIGGAAITTIKDSIKISGTPTPTKHFVAGKSWGWEDPKNVIYLPKEGMTDDKTLWKKYLVARLDGAA